MSPLRMRDDRPGAGASVVHHLADSRAATTPSQPARSRFGRVVAVGGINIDTTLLVSRLPKPGESITATGTATGGGGKGANAALASALAGSPTSLVGSVGSTVDSQAALAYLLAVGIDLDSVVSIDEAVTGRAVVLVESGGENCVVVSPGANAHLSSTHVRQVIGRLSDVAVVLANLEVPDDAVVAAAEAATARAAQLIVNPAPARRLPAALYAHRPLLTPNTGEAATLTGVADPESAARALHQRSAQPVVVTLGRRGVLLFDGACVRRFSAPTVDAVDSTGAGDTFNGVLASALARGLLLPDAIAIAVDKASRSAQLLGAQPAPALPRK